MTFAASELSEDAFLGGRIRLRQPHDGYRAATDPVFLAATVPARPGESVLDLGCGAGAALYCLAARVPDLSLTGLELQPDYAALARANAALNGLGAQIIEGDVAAPPAELAELSFDHVIANPPYFAHGTATAPGDDGRGRAHLEGAATLGAFLALGRKRLKPRGWLTMIHRAERLGDILAGLAPGFGDMRVLPLSPRRGRAANRVVVAARKGASAPLILLPPLVVHAGEAHGADGADYSRAAEAVLRGGAPLRLQSRGATHS